MHATKDGRTVEVLAEDLLEQEVDAIVNAANEGLEHGGGIAAIIARAAGPELDRESRAHAPVPTGSAGITTAGRLPQRAVIHAVGPVWRGGCADEAALLASAHGAAVAVADDHDFVSVALPAISCGVFGYPAKLAAQAAVPSVMRALEDADHVRLVRFCLVHGDHLDAFGDALRHAAGEAGWALQDGAAAATA